MKRIDITNKQLWPKDRYQLLCFNCNCAKERNGGVLPPERKDKYKCV